MMMLVRSQTTMQYPVNRIFMYSNEQLDISLYVFVVSTPLFKFLSLLTMSFQTRRFHLQNVDKFSNKTYN